MNISYYYPQMIYLDDNKTIKSVIQNAELFHLTTLNLNIGDWCNTKNIINKCYIVKPLDTFESVAKILNISLKDLKSIAKTKHLYVGQKIIF